MNTVFFTSNSEEWATPPEVFKALDQEFHFDLDPCATPENAKCKDFYTIDIDGLTQNWGGATCVLQSTVWPEDWLLGAEMLGRIPETGHPCGRPHPGPDGYPIFSRIHIPQGEGGPFSSRPSALQQRGTGSLPFNGCNLLKPTI